MKTCPFFGICGGCKYDVASSDYREKKLSELSGLPLSGNAVWTDIKSRRRADFAFADGVLGFYKSRSKNIVPVHACMLMCSEINDLLPFLSVLPWNGSGSCLVTVCDNGIDVAVNSSVTYFSSEFKKAVNNLPKVIRVTWNGQNVMCKEKPQISFDGKTIDYPSGAFLQPAVSSEKVLRDMVVSAALGTHRIADLFCGLGNFTFALGADGFDIAGTGVRRDLFKQPLTVGMLKQYDCVVMDPPRAGALAQCKELIKSTVQKVIYVSCNPITWKRDSNILLQGGFSLKELIPVDQFVGSSHWELFSVFVRKK